MWESWDEIVAAISGQDENVARAAFTQAIGQLEPKILAFLIRRLGMQPCDADECVQRTWLKVWMLRGLADRERHFRSWVYQIARNEAADVHRRNRRQVQWSEQTDAMETVQPCESPSQAELSPAGEPPGQNLWQRLRRVLDAMAADDREILDAWSHGTADQWITSELLERIGLTRKNLRVRLHRLKRRLQSVARQIEQEAPARDPRQTTLRLNPPEGLWGDSSVLAAAFFHLRT